MKSDANNSVQINCGAHFNFETTSNSFGKVPYAVWEYIQSEGGSRQGYRKERGS